MKKITWFHLNGCPYCAKGEKAFEELKKEYDRLAWDIPDYNFWDFAVTMNKMYADHIDVVGKWSKNKDTTRKRISELAISFLCDESTNHPTDKIWWYMNS